MDNLVDTLFSDPAPMSDSGAATAPAFAPVEQPAAPAIPQQQIAPPIVPAAPQAPNEPPALDPWGLSPAQSQQPAAPEVPDVQSQGEQPAAPVESAPAAPALPGQLGNYIEAYGAENVEALANMAFGLMGIGDIPEGKTPQAHFLDQIYGFDQRAYSQLVSEVERSHESDFVTKFRDKVLAAEGLPTSAEELQKLRDYARYGNQYVADEESRAVIEKIPQQLHATFQRQSEAYRNYLVSQVAGGYMPPEVAVEMLQRAENDYQRDVRDNEARQQYEQQQQQQVELQAHRKANQVLAEQRERIIEQKAKADNLHPEIVRDIYARAGQELEEFANAAMYGYAKSKEEFEIGQAAIRGYRSLVEAQKTGSPLAVKQAMNSLRILAEQRYAHHLQGRRSRATAQPAQQQQPQAPQHPAQLQAEQPRPGYTLPNGANLVDALFG